MLVHLSIHNYAIVEHLDLEIARGMSVITGETGAGKSIMLDALGLALGDRADSGVVRPGTDKADILAGFERADTVRVQRDRGRAIAQAIAEAEPGDIVLIAGKGHEPYQEIDGVQHPFDDRQVAQAALAARETEGAR